MTTKPSPPQAGVAMSRDDAALLRLKKLEDMAECGTVDNWMKLTDDQKRMWFALCVDESSRRKAAENELESLRAAPPPSVVPFQLACRVRELVGIIDGRGHTQISETVCEEALALIADTSAAALRAQGAGEPVCAGPFVDARDCPVHAKDVQGQQSPPTVPTEVMRDGFAVIRQEARTALGASCFKKWKDSMEDIVLVCDRMLAAVPPPTEAKTEGKS